MCSEPTIRLDDETYGYLKFAVRLHRIQLSGGFMTSLGDRFLLEVFRNVARSRHGIALVAILRPEGAETVEGFLLGATSTAGLYRDFILRRGLKAAIIAAPRLLRWSAIRKVWETLSYPATESNFDMPQAELLDLAVSDSAKGTGIAEKLFSAFVAELECRGHQSFRVTTGESLTRAHRFYEKQGVVRVGTIEIHQGESIVVYAYEAPGDRVEGERVR